MSIASRIARSAIVASAVAVLVVGSTLPASASVRPSSLVIDGESALSVEYGQDWYFSFTIPNCYADGDFTIARNDKTIGPGRIYRGVGSFSSYEFAPFPVGTSTLTITTNTVCGTDTAKPTVKVAVAPVTVDARITQDPSAPSNAIVSLEARGDVIDRIGLSGSAGKGVRFPSGTWAVSVGDAAKKTVYEKKIASEFGGATYATAYWMGTPADQKLTATATFTPSGETADDFAVTQPAPFDFTTSDRQAQTLVRPADDGPPAGLSPSGFTVPLWSIVAGSLLGALALIVGLIGVIRWRRALGARAIAGEAVTDAEGVRHA